MEFTTKSAQETQKLGQEIGTKLEDFRTSKDNAIVFALTGDLGSGKTTFSQGFARGLGIEKRILSPTFILMRRYEIESHGFNIFYHVDLYRLEEGIKDEIKNLGIDEVFNDPKSLILIEWAEKAKEFLPKWAIWIEFEELGDEERKITVTLPATHQSS